MRPEYETWLKSAGYQAPTIATQLSRIGRVEQCYGDLDVLIESGNYESLITELTYSTSDERRNRPNPSKIVIAGNIRTNLQSYKNAVVLYHGFAETRDPSEAPPSSVTSISSPSRDEQDQQKLSLERDMQAALRRAVDALGEGLTIIDDGVERGVTSGFIDILCRDEAGHLVVVELKAGKADARVIGQTLGYMGDLMTEEDAPVRGLIVAHDFDQRTRSAAKAIPNLRLYRYSVTFRFERDA